MAKILVVDDEKISLALVKFGLKAEDLEVVTARDGEMALKKIQEETFDLIVLDIMMPNVNGYEFLAESRKLLDERVPPVFILTSNEKLEDMFNMECVKGYFVKPVNISEFVGEIKTCLGLS